MDLPSLRDILVKYFSDSELRDVCFDLGIDYENLGGDVKVGKARELVAYCQRRNRLAELEATCRRLRPHAFQDSHAASTEPASPTPRTEGQPAGTVVSQSGGATINAQTVNIYGDVTGRDKIDASSGSGKTSTPTPPPPSALSTTPPPTDAAYQYDVFISYSSKDKTWVRGELLHTLEEHGLRLCIDYRDFRPGAPSIKEIEHAITTSRKTLLILTPDYLASEWTEFENLLLQTLEPSNQNLRLIPLLKVRCDLPLRLKFMTYVNFVDPDDWDIAWRQLLTALGVTLIQATTARETPSTWYLAHPYGMPPNFTGRVDERQMLSTWLNNDHTHPLIVIRALGGFGKSALAWHWLMHDVNATHWPRVVWWSFYEGDASFDNFLRDTLKYLKVDAQGLGPRQQVDALLRELQTHNTLLVLDGFERALRAFSSMNAAYQGDSAPSTENRGRVGEGGDHPHPDPLPNKGEGDAERDCISPFAEHFLRGVASLPNLRGKVLMTTRLCPRILQTRSGELLQGCVEKELLQMQPADAVAFFRAQGVRGSRTEIEAACSPYGYHPLSLRLLAGLIIGDFQQPGDIAVAKRLDVSGDLIQRQHHVLQQSYNSLTLERQKLLSRIACFRSGVNYNALHALADKDDANNFDSDLRDLLARGLLHRDDKTNRFDLHPIVRRYAYDRLTTGDRTAAHIQLRVYFVAVPKPAKVQTLDDLQPVIELYHHTVRAGQYDDARTLMRDRLIPTPLIYQFGAYQLCIELLNVLFPAGEERLPHLKGESAQAWTLLSLGNIYGLNGQPRRAVPLFEQHNAICEEAGGKTNLAVGLGNLANRHRDLGVLRAAEANLRRSIDLCREIKDEFDEAVGHQNLGRLLAYRGVWAESEQELATALTMFEKDNNVQSQCIVWSYRALRALLIARTLPSPIERSLLDRRGVGGEALSAARRALELAEGGDPNIGGAVLPRDLVRAHWLLGAAHRFNDDLPSAEYHLSEALTRCRNINMVDHEANILLDLARLRAQSADQNERGEALRLAEEALLITERSGYVLQGADVHLFLAREALKDNDTALALQHAREARRLATCDGPPDYTYKVAYDEAGALLQELGER